MEVRGEEAERINLLDDVPVLEDTRVSIAGLLYACANASVAESMGARNSERAR